MSELEVGKGVIGVIPALAAETLANIGGMVCR
jgi:hypothetical protein